MNNTFKKAFISSVTLKSKIIEETDFNHLADLGNKIVNAITKGGKLLICGNGGSAADAQKYYNNKGKAPHGWGVKDGKVYKT